MAQPYPPYQGMTPQDVASARQYGQGLMQQGTDASPVGHWTQALARVLQGGVGGYEVGSANRGEAEGRASANKLLAQALQGGDLKSSVGSMLAHPWAAEKGGHLAQTMIGQRIHDSSPAAQARLKAAQGAEARAAAMHPLQLQEAQLGIQAKQRELENPAGKINIVPEGGTLVSTDPRTGQHRVIAQGAPKIDPTTRKEIVEADDMVSQTNAATSALDKAIELNKSAYAGAGADKRAWVTNNTAGMLVDRPGALATRELENVITNQALQSLRATFGGNPTEGERKILLQVAGSVNEPAAVRQRIFAEARRLAEIRLNYNRERSAAMRGGTYYQPGGQPQSLSQPQQASPLSAQGQQGAIAPGAYVWNPQTGLQPKPGAP